VPAVLPRLTHRQLTLLAATWLCAAAWLGAGAWAAPSAHAYVARLSVGATPVGRPIPSNFLGLALEVNEIPGLSGPTPQSANPVFARLLRNLDPAGSPVVRIGGQSTDRAWWPVPGMSRPLGVTYNLTPAWTAAARALAQATGARFLLGVNLEANRARIAQVEGAQLLNGIGRQHIDALQIGNEPDLYTVTPWYRRLGGRPLPWYGHAGTPVFSRAPGYGPQDFVAELGRTLKVLPRLPIAGPETGSPPWADAFDRLLSPHSQVRMLTSHAYGLIECVTDPSSAAYPSVPHLLSLDASRGIVDGITPYVALAHRNGAAYRVDELGSISCNGRAGVSNTLASALWVMDALFTLDSDGVDGVNLHTYPNSVNGLFDFTRVHGTVRGIVHPIYYGALMFAQAAPPGSRLLTVDAGSQPQLRAWATVGSDHRVRVLLINDSLSSSALALVGPPAGSGSASRPGTLSRLRASSAYATGGVTLGGQSFGAATATGVLTAPAVQTVMPRGGSYPVTLPAGSAALLTLSP
jgi:hypothetical protein